MSWKNGSIQGHIESTPEFKVIAPEALKLSGLATVWQPFSFKVHNLLPYKFF